MSNRTEASGDQRAIANKLAARYDSEVESEVIRWFKELLGEELKAGMRELEKALRNGQSLVKLGGKVQEGTASCPEKAKKMKMKPNTLDAPFKQMENIQTFLTFCENYGVPKTSLFQTVDLYEGRNMAQVISCIQQLGTECQRNGFKGPVIGPKPTEKNVREFSEEQLRAGEGMIGLQAGSNKGATQSGMGSGVRHIADIKVEEMSKDGANIIGLQAGSNKGATQSGMGSGVRHIADIKVDEMSKDGANIIGLQAGSNKGANQSGMSIGGARHVADIKVDAASKEGQSMIGLQMGSNEGASQSGMSIGAKRQIN